ncbi:D-ribitol-5-phosphate cytidylyltransferase-like [Mytilus californianus]|uniref:D-ribitol-5-phosphate cytidylyltransferase-like n=1 Tax=Mytilus californianus TaxID=6549 RepID=UPI0022456A25|nr:D-ribitol-5-phosphate cytidylyltransferase-like [Mytilus californianus]
MDLENVCVVLPAGGCGVRMEMDTPKQYCKVLNRPLILYTIHSFHRLSWIKMIVVVVDVSYLEIMQNLLTKYKFTKVKIVTGSPTRHRSIYNGVKALETVCKPDDVVLIHDAVRMFTDEQTITQIAMTAKEHKASGVYRPLISTVIAPDSDGFLEESLDRNRYRASEMPQGFHYSVISTAYQKATDYDFDYGTECLLLASKYSGVKARLVEGSSNLWKVTHKKDIFAAEGILKESDISVCLNCEDVRLRESLTKQFQRKKFKIHQLQEDQNKENNIEPSVFIHVVDCNEHLTQHMVACSDKFISHCDNSACYLLDRVLMLVVREIPCESYHLTIIRLMKNLKKKHQDKETLVYCVVYQDETQTEQLTEMVTSVVWNRDPVLSGQVLFVS